MRGRVVHVRDRVPGAVYVGRTMPYQGLLGHKLQNPFRITAKSSRQDVIRKYRAYLLGKGRPLLAALPALRGKDLACWCRHLGEQPTDDNLCHADVILALLDIFTDADLERMARENPDDHQDC